MKVAKEWKVQHVTRDDLNDQLYALIDPILDPKIEIAELHSRAFDTKQILRELIDNIYKHDSATSLGFELEEKNNNIKIKIFKNGGGDFNPFSDNSPCHLIKKIKYNIKFKEKMTLTESVRRTLSFSFNLSDKGE